MVNREKVPVTLGEQTFEFELCSQMINFAEAGVPAVEYFLMDSRDLRAGGPNYRTCLDLWWACMEDEGLTVKRAGHSDDDREQVQYNEENLVLAALYPLVAKDKGSQKVIRNATPRRPFRDAASNCYSLEPAEARLLRTLAQKRDVPEIGDEIKKVLVGALPPVAEKTRFSEAFQVWLDKGVDALRGGGRKGMKAFLEDDLMPWLRKYRQRGDEKAGSGSARLFINMVACEARAAFNTCFANAWVLLVPWLREHRSLSPASERLLELLHNQNPRDDGKDVFWGEVLSLHPSSDRLLESPDHKAVLGRYLASVAKHGVGTSIDNANNSAFWDFVGATLVAFHEYVRQFGVDEALRVRTASCRRQPKKNVSRERKEADLKAKLFEDFAAAKGLRCESCNSPELMFRLQELQDVSNQKLRVTYACATCGKTCVEVVSADDLRDVADGAELSS